MKFDTKTQSANKQLKHISFPLLSWFLKITFLIILLSFTFSVVLKSNPTFYTTLGLPPPIQNQQDNVVSFSNEESQNVPENSRPARRLHNFTDFTASLNKVGPKFWISMKPSFDCPKNLLTKFGGSEIGGPRDGGKWTCGINNLGKISATSLKTEQQPCLMYSFGVNKDSSFEADILGSTHCEIYAYDPSVDTIGKPLRSTNPRVHFEKLGISGDDSGDMRTLKTLMQQNGGHKWIDILKMDVEHAEYPTLERILKDFSISGDESMDDDDENEFGIGLPFGQLLIEMHIKKTDKNNITQQVISLFQRLEKSGLRMFYKEINPSCGNNWCSEFSFINVNQFSLERFLGNDEY